MVPFIALTMANDFAMSAVAIGVVLGARTFAQQGMFLVGGAISDRWGARYTMVAGCIVRVRCPSPPADDVHTNTLAVLKSDPRLAKYATQA